MGIWATGTLNQLFIRGSYAEIKFSKELFSGGTQRFAMGLFCTFHSICVNIEI